MCGNSRAIGKRTPLLSCMLSHNLSTICQQLRFTYSDSSSGANEHSSNLNWIIAPPAAYELLEQCLDLNPLNRISAYQAINHRFFI